jgi:hypothetical protein
MHTVEKGHGHLVDQPKVGQGMSRLGKGRLGDKDGLFYVGSIGGDLSDLDKDGGGQSQETKRLKGLQSPRLISVQKRHHFPRGRNGNRHQYSTH